MIKMILIFKSVFFRWDGQRNQNEKAAFFCSAIKIILKQGCRSGSALYFEAGSGYALK
jgi:hypothetical protein